jgi:hypothetical protein
LPKIRGSGVRPETVRHRASRPPGRTSHVESKRFASQMAGLAEIL